MMILLSKIVYLPYEFRDLTVGEGLKYKLYYTILYYNNYYLACVASDLIEVVIHGGASFLI